MEDENIDEALGGFPSLAKRKIKPSAESSVQAAPRLPVVTAFGGRQLVGSVSRSDRAEVRRVIFDYNTNEQTFADRAANSANTAQQLGTLLGGPLAVAGVIAAVSATGPIAIAAGIAAACGALITLGGLTVGHALRVRTH